MHGRVVMDHVVASQLVDRIYACALASAESGPADWGGVLNGLADLARADVAWLGIVLPDLGVAEVVAPRTDPDLVREYAGHWWTKDPMLPAVLGAPVGRLVSLADAGRDRYLASEFFGDFWRRSGHAAERLSTTLVTGPAGVARLGLQPSRRSESIEPEMVEAFAVFVPHLVRSVQVSCAIRRAELEVEAARRAPGGVLMVDAEARLVVADEAGRRALAGREGVRVEDGRVVLPSRQSTERLHRLIRQCRTPPSRSGPTRPAWADGEDARTWVDVMPVPEERGPLGPEHVRHPRPVAMLLLRDPAGRRRAARALLGERFGLTPAEAEVAIELMQGDGRAAAAERLGVSLATVRTHMMRVFSKVGVGSQAGLVGRMATEGVTPEAAS